ncbi:MAG: class I SAM-dependent RNA methyltransferase [Acidobacteriota bacterium]|nr:class I SAM-dependent RNA methyltransferase [Acidobacteriota bacterium]
MSSAEVRKETFEVKIERLLPGGVGLAHANGLTLFVSLAAPGDVLRVSLDRVQGKVGFASIVEILKSSPARVEPPCPYFGRCGGCDFQQLNYEAQLNAKVEIIKDCLHRIARLEVPFDIAIHRAPNEWHYRARANWQVDAKSKLLGYFERGSNRVCDVEYCAVLAPDLQETLEQVRKKIAHEPNAPPGSIDAVAGDEGVSLAPEIAQFQTREASRVIENETYYFSAEAFFQVNHKLVEPLVNEALRDSTAEVQGRTAIDLYCGVGLFTLPLARRFARVVGVEANGRATEFARRNLEFAKLENADIITARVGDWMTEHSHSFGPVDFLLLDPPRTGAENKDTAGILALRPARIAYVSCDPATLARDLKKLTAAGYSLDSVVAFDMFPQTHHVETVTRLVRCRLD